MPAVIQGRLMAYYGLGELPRVDRFVSACSDLERERLVVRDAADGVEVALRLPPAAIAGNGPRDLDGLCQLVEGVSHFLLVAERARRELPTTELELELQAEVDKFVLLGVARERPLDSPAVERLHKRLFGAVHFIDPPGTEKGDRYRMAHDLAMRFTHRLDREYMRCDRRAELRRALQHFYRVGQATKITLARAA